MGDRLDKILGEILLGFILVMIFTNTIIIIQYVNETGKIVLTIMSFVVAIIGLVSLEGGNKNEGTNNED